MKKARIIFCTIVAVILHIFFKQSIAADLKLLPTPQDMPHRNFHEASYENLPNNALKIITKGHGGDIGFPVKEYSGQFITISFETKISRGYAKAGIDRYRNRLIFEDEWKVTGPGFIKTKAAGKIPFNEELFGVLRVDTNSEVIVYSAEIIPSSSYKEYVCNKNLEKSTSLVGDVASTACNLIPQKVYQTACEILFAAIPITREMFCN